MRRVIGFSVSQAALNSRRFAAPGETRHPIAGYRAVHHNAHMTADEAGFSAWNACSAVAERLVAAADALPGHALKRHGRFQTWEIDAHAGDALMRTLINLALFAAVRDESVHHPRPATDIIGTLQISTLEEALYSRPRHEFFASLPITALDQQDKQRIQALRLLTYHTGDRCRRGRDNRRNFRFRAR
jgi:hypothetical protein